MNDEKSTGIPWIKFVPGDFHRDTHHLSYEEQCAYWWILEYLYVNGPIPVDQADLTIRRKIRCPLDIARSMLEEFCFISEEDSCYHQKRVDQDRAKAKGISAERSHSAKQGIASKQRLPDGTFAPSVQQMPANAGDLSSKIQLYKNKELRTNMEEERTNIQEIDIRTNTEERDTEKIENQEEKSLRGQNRFDIEDKEDYRRRVKEEAFYQECRDKCWEVGSYNYEERWKFLFGVNPSE